MPRWFIYYLDYPNIEIGYVIVESKDLHIALERAFKDFGAFKTEVFPTELPVTSFTPYTKEGVLQ